MDEAPIDLPAVRGDGFEGQRFYVVPRPVAREALQAPVTSRLLVTDAGFFPHAARHGRERTAGVGQHILLVCADGSGWCSTREDRYEIQAGDAVLLQAGVPHAYGASPDRPWTLWWFHFAGTDAADLVAAARAVAGGPISHLREHAPIARLIAQIIDSLSSGTSGGLISASGAAWNALAQIIASGRRSPGSALSPAERAVEHLRASAPHRTPVEDLAAMVGLSTSQFAAVFREHVGVPPLRYQTNLRMAMARDLLDGTDRSVAAVAQECGYEDALYFSRQFARVHGLSPSAYRGRAR